MSNAPQNTTTDSDRAGLSSAYQDKAVRIYCGHVLDILPQLPAESVHTCVTSPPFWGLRNYGVPSSVWPDGWVGCYGLEPTPELYVQHTVEIFREVRRVLRDDGTLWLNLGDSYQNAKGQAGGVDPKQPARRHGLRPQDVSIPGLKPKDLVGIPWRVAFALQADGWYLRSDIIWHKPNPMPESVQDRPTKAHEYIFLLTKNAKYFYDADAIREPHKNPEDLTRPPTSAHPDNGTVLGRDSSPHCGLLTNKAHPNGRNKRSVWTVSTKPFPGAHFAVFPPDLIEPCILAGTSNEGCCPECGAPWVPVVEKERKPTRPARDNVLDPTGMANRDPQRHCTVTKTTGWRPDCECDPFMGNETGGAGGFPPVPCTVLDPFMGSGTTAVVAKENGRHAIGIELNPDYIVMAEERMPDDLLF